ncbi:MAG: stage II sporulation protein M [Methanobacterium sp.]|uniref:stage II sporulation protein M n=1 Tax=Methanobacterium sp. TaxID=2164 RepID=UPI003D6614CD|nr:stage II sporulation protein M [Methanobacterium sp.]
MLDKRFDTTGTEYEGFLNGIYKRNETFLIISAAIFLSSLFVGYLFSGVIDSFMASVLKSFKQSVSKGEIKLTTLSIFMNNLKIAFYIYGGGITAGLLTVYFLVFNGIFIGYAASKFALGDFLIYTVPHGIFEVVGIIIAGAAGFRLASMIINLIRDLLRMKRYMPMGDQISQVLDVNYPEFRESVILFVIAIVLILIGAVIEANFTLALGNYIKGSI